VPTRVLLEGRAIEPLLAQVRQEYGSGVRIISADKVRSGGFGGFFAKQHYELSVEVPDPAEDAEESPPRPSPVSAPPARPSDDGPSSLEQLLERAESRDHIAPGETPRPPALTAPHPTVVQPKEALDRQTGWSAGTDDAETAADRNFSTTGAAFAELMAGLDAANHIATSGPARPSTRPKAAIDKPETQTVRPFLPAVATGAPVNGGPGKPLPPAPSLAELMGGLGVTDSAIAFAPAMPQPPAPGRSAAAAYGLRPTSAPPAAVVVPVSTPPAWDGPTWDAPAAIAPAPVPTPEPTGGTVALRPSAHTDPVIANLISVGMPVAMAEDIMGGDTYAGVLSVLASRPAAPTIPNAPGEILVLAGDLGHAVPIAKRLLEQIGLDQTHLLLAGPSASGTGVHSSKVIHTVVAAEARAEKLQSADSAWIVVLDAPVGETDPVWVNDMCDAIGATAVWAIVDATRKTADTARHLRTLGEVEALVVHSVELTADPATVLGLNLPIFSLDGRPATPHAWAAMLCARIAADIMPMAAAPRRVARTVRR
jgi:hypothetical protein